MSKQLQPWEVTSTIAENAHEEYQGRSAAIVYVCVLAFGWAALTVFDVPVASDIVRFFNEMFCGLFDAIFDRKVNSSDIYVRTIVDGQESFMPVENTPKGKPVSYAPLAAVALLLTYIAHQRYMASRAEKRWHFFGGHGEH